MADALARIYEGAVTANSGATTTLFTVPRGETWILRLFEGHAGFAGGGGYGSGRYPSSVVTPTILIYKNGTTADKVVMGLPLKHRPAAVLAGKLAVSIPFLEGEVCYASITGLPYAERLTWDTQPDDFGWNKSTTVDATSFSIPAMYPGGNSSNFYDTQIGMPANVYIPIVNTKATTPDAVNFVQDVDLTSAANGPRAAKLGSISTAAAATIRATWWGGFGNSGRRISGGSFTADFNGVSQTSFRGTALSFNKSAMVAATPSTSNVLRSATTNTGTTSTSITVTQTPLSSTAVSPTFQVFLAAASLTLGSETFTAPAADGTCYEFANDTLSTPNSRAAIYIIDPPQTNPVVTVSANPTAWAASVLEVYKAGALPNLSISGIKVKK